MWEKYHDGQFYSLSNLLAPSFFSMIIYRTPDERFANLPDWNDEPQYLEITDRHSQQQLRMAYVDVGPRTGKVVLLLHGEPSWSYLYRHMIPPLASQGARVLAPDLIGFGRSDKPAARSDATYENWVQWLESWFLAMDLSHVILFCQDYGGLLGLRLVAKYPEKFAGVIVANTGLPIGKKMSEGFYKWQTFSQKTDDMPVAQIIQSSTNRTLSSKELAAYEAPFPDARFKSAPCQGPLNVPCTPDSPSVTENILAWQSLSQFNRPFITAFSDNDPVTEGGAAIFQKLIPGAFNERHVTLKGGHFLQEDCPQEINALIQELLDRSPSVP
jgi:haloalkane dehalogenase